MNIGEKIQKILKAKGITHSELATKMGVSRQMISALVKSESTTTETLERISKAINEPLVSFFDDKVLYGDSEHVSERIWAIKKTYYLLGSAYKGLKKDNPDVDRSRIAIKLAINYFYKKVIGGGFTMVDTDDNTIKDNTFGDCEPDFAKKMEDLISQTLVTDKFLDD